MKSEYQTELTSTDRLLSCLSLAIDEAKLVRSIITSKDLAHHLKSDQPFSERLVHLNREISYLESQLSEVRKLATRGKNNSHTTAFIVERLL